MGNYLLPEDDLDKLIWVENQVTQQLGILDRRVLRNRNGNYSHQEITGKNSLRVEIMEKNRKDELRLPTLEKPT